MFKKLLLIILILLCSCNKKETIQYNEDSFIVPTNNVNIYAELENEELKQRLKLANNGNDYSNEQFKLLFKDVYDKDLIDINGKAVNLTNYENLLIEVLSPSCIACCKTVKNHLNDLLKCDLTIVQYFEACDKQDVLDFYNELEIAIPENLIIIVDDQLHDYICGDLNIEIYPQLICYKNHKVSFNIQGDFDAKNIATIYDIGFVDIIKVDDLLDSDEKNIIDKYLSIADVKKQISEENKAALASIDNDDYTSQLTYSIIGKKVDFTSLPEKYSSVYISEIDDYSYYKDKDLVLLYAYLYDDSEVEKIEFINTLTETNENFEYIVIFMEGLRSSSSAYKQMNVKINNAKIVSILGNIPSEFCEHELVAYPSAIFVKQGYYAGACSNIESVEEFKKASDLFLSDKSIALKINN